MTSQLISHLEQKGLNVRPDYYHKDACLNDRQGELLFDYYIAICNQKPRTEKEGLIVKAEKERKALLYLRCQEGGQEGSVFYPFDGTLRRLFQFAKDARPFHPEYRPDGILAYESVQMLGRNLGLNVDDIQSYWEKVMPINLSPNRKPLVARGTAESITKTFEKAASEHIIVDRIMNLGKAVQSCLEPISPKGVKRLENLTKAYAFYLFECGEMRPDEAVKVVQSNVVGLYAREVDNFDLYFNHRLRRIVLESLPGESGRFNHVGQPIEQLTLTA